MPSFLAWVGRSGKGLEYRELWRVPMLDRLYIGGFGRPGQSSPLLGGSVQCGALSVDELQQMSS